MKRPIDRLASILGLALLAAAPLQAGVNRWTSIGPSGGGVKTLVFSANGRTALASTETAGVFRSTNNGRTWTAANNGLSGEVADLAASSTVPGWVYAVTSSGFFRSDDAGLHWTAAGAGLPSLRDGVNVAVLATEPTQPAAVWAVIPGEQRQTLYRSENRGDRWQYAGRGLGEAVRDVAAHPITAGVVFAGTNHGLFRSTDSGGHWRPSGLRGLDITRVVFDRVQPRHLYAVSTEEGSQGLDIGTIFFSDDGGASWKNSGQEFHIYKSRSFELEADPARAGTAWLVNLSSVHKTRDGGRHWRRVLGADDWKSLAANPLRPGTVLAGVAGPFTDERTGIFRTDDGGTSWSPSDTGITAQTVLQVVPHPSKPGGLYALVSCCELWERPGAGQPFTLVPTGIEDPYSLILDPKTPSTRYLVGSSALYKSVDAGATWRKINSPSIFSLTIDPAHPSTLYGASESERMIYRSDDGGFSWTALGASSEITANRVTATGTALYAYGYESNPPYRGGLFRIAADGTAWTILLELTSVTALAEDPRDPRRLWAAFVEYSGGSGPDTGGLYRSTDGGAHWSLSRVPGNRPVLALALDPRNSNRLWAASTGAVFLSEDGGATWVSFSEGLPSLDIRDLRLDLFDPDTLYAATDGGSVYELTRRRL